MKKQPIVDELIDEAMNSIDRIERASAKPFLLTRIQSRLNLTTTSIWEKASRLVGRPAVVIPGLALLVIVNALAIAYNRTDDFTTGNEQAMQQTNDEFSYTVATIYDIENTEP